ncbi:GNAT family N-acetyltransferase [Parasphingorhabdus sp.]|uniref:GNAT family N-acetyltransferase n=1 Tax=Parasphingorhabdus sp. TaxID=2709688 RepID=UPI00326304A5
MNFRRAAVGDIDTLHALVESAYRGESAKRGWTHEADLLGGQRTDARALHEIIVADDQVILLAQNGQALAGCVQLSNVGNGLAYLGLLTVDPTKQATGLGKQLLLQSETFVRETWQAVAIEMTVIRQRADLIAYYERRGYMQTGEYRPFPHDDPRFGLPKTSELEFTVLRKPI